MAAIASRNRFHEEIPPAMQFFKWSRMHKLSLEAIGIINSYCQVPNPEVRNFFKMLMQYYNKQMEHEIKYKEKMRREHERKQAVKMQRLQNAHEKSPDSAIFSPDSGSSVHSNESSTSDEKKFRPAKDDQKCPDFKSSLPDMALNQPSSASKVSNEVLSPRSAEVEKKHPIITTADLKKESPAATTTTVSTNTDDDDEIEIIYDKKEETKKKKRKEKKKEKTVVKKEVIDEAQSKQDASTDKFYNSDGTVAETPQSPYYKDPPSSSDLAEAHPLPSSAAKEIITQTPSVPPMSCNLPIKQEPAQSAATTTAISAPSSTPGADSSSLTLKTPKLERKSIEGETQLAPASSTSVADPPLRSDLSIKQEPKEPAASATSSISAPASVPAAVTNSLEERIVASDKTESASLKSPTSTPALDPQEISKASILPVSTVQQPSLPPSIPSLRADLSNPSLLSNGIVTLRIVDEPSPVTASIPNSAVPAAAATIPKPLRGPPPKTSTPLPRILPERQQTSSIIAPVAKKLDKKEKKSVKFNPGGPSVRTIPSREELSEAAPEYEPLSPAKTVMPAPAALKASPSLQDTSHPSAPLVSSSTTAPPPITKTAKPTAAHVDLKALERYIRKPTQVKPAHKKPRTSLEEWVALEKEIKTPTSTSSRKTENKPAAPAEEDAMMQPVLKLNIKKEPVDTVETAPPVHDPILVKILSNNLVELNKKVDRINDIKEKAIAMDIKSTIFIKEEDELADPGSTFTMSYFKKLAGYVSEITAKMISELKSHKDTEVLETALRYVAEDVDKILKSVEAAVQAHRASKVKKALEKKEKPKLQREQSTNGVKRKHTSNEFDKQAAPKTSKKDL